MPIFLLLLLYPVAEIYAWYVFISKYSFIDAVFWCFLSAIVGYLVLKINGVKVFREFQKVSQEGKMPSSQIVHSTLVSIGGLLLIFPGVITDIVGTILVLPGFRHFVVWYFKQSLAAKIAKGTVRFSQNGFVFTGTNRGGFSGFPGGFPPGAGPQGPLRDVTPEDPKVIDVQATVIDDKKD